MTLHVKVAERLVDIEAELRRLNLWECEAPSAEQLASTSPFHVDTLSFTQWLQFIFLPRMRDLTENNLPLPSTCNIAPMAEEYFKPLGLDSHKLILHIAVIDQLLSN